MESVDMVVILICLAAMAGVGFYFMRRNKDADTHLKAGRLGCLFFMGIFMKRVNGFAATCGLVANYIVCFGLDRLTFAGKPHLLLFGFPGTITCLALAPIASMMKGGRK